MINMNSLNIIRIDSEHDFDGIYIDDVDYDLIIDAINKGMKHHEVTAYYGFEENGVQETNRITIMLEHIVIIERSRK